MRIILILLISITTFVVEARMYQWVEPGVETTQLSGKPPTWYRSTSAGPRVFVFDKGRLIDDTAVEVSDDVRQRMRQEAFLLVEEDRQKAKAKMAKAQEMKDKLKQTESDSDEEFSRDEEEGSDIELITESLFPEEDKEDDQDNQEGIAEKSLDELKAMIAEWERSQTEDARKAIE